MNENQGMSPDGLRESQRRMREWMDGANLYVPFDCRADAPSRLKAIAAIIEAASEHPQGTERLSVIERLERLEARLGLPLGVVQEAPPLASTLA